MAQVQTQYHHHDFEPPVSPIQTDFPTPPRGHPHNNESGNVSPTPVSPIMVSRSESVDSDRYSSVSGLTNNLPNNPTNVNPPPAYVADFGASQVVSEHQASKGKSLSDDEDNEDKSKDDVQFKESALALVNAFLDQLLFSFLSTARSTSLLALRPAVTEVLKHRLAREAIASADAELSELLAGGDEEDEMDAKHKASEDNRRWDLELVWKRTRLRVMVYMRLGEMEDDDEQRYIREEDLFYGNERRFSSSIGLVSWSAAIFLTSVLEYVAEQTLQVAGQAAFTRARRQSRGHRRSLSKGELDLVVEDHDVDKIALNSTLGRLWRTWRKALRNNEATATPTGRSSVSRASRENMVSALSHRSEARDGSIANDSRPVTRDADMPEMDYPEHVLAANISLPIGNHTRDIDEIVVPGLARDPDEEDEAAESSDEPYAEHELALLVALPLADEKRDIEDIEYTEYEIALLVALLVADEKRDVEEIEVPGLAKDPDAEEENKVVKEQVRRKSFTGYLPYRTTGGLPTPEDSVPASPGEADRPAFGRQRSSSLPTPARTPMLVEDEAPEVPEMGHDLSAEEAEQIKPENDTEESKALDGGANDKAVNPKASAPTPKAEYPWMTAGAAAGASAAVAAWATGSSKRFSQALESDAVDEDAVRKEKEERRKSWKDVNSASQKSLSAKEIEELDKRKSLIDIKSMMIVNGYSAQTSGRQSPQDEEHQMSPLSQTVSNESFTLAGAEDAQDNAIGVARTVDGQIAAQAASDEQRAKEDSRRPSRLVIADSPIKPSSAKSQESPTKQSATPKTPRQFLDLTAGEDGDEAQNDASATRRSPRSMEQSSTADRSPNGIRRGSEPSLHKKQGSDVQQHPMVQRMASLKGSEPSSASESEKHLPLTSAAIRGPEDFDMFVQGGDTLKYTLTPEHVRDDPTEGPIRYARQSPVDTDAASQSSKQPPNSSDSRAGRSQRPKQTTSTTDGETRETRETTREEKRRSASRPAPRNISAHRRSGLMAREPRVMTESTRDFADFIRSTGPNKETAVYPIMANASTTSLHSLRSAHIHGASASRSSSPAPDRSNRRSYIADGEDVPPVPPIPGAAATPSRSKSTKSTMEARSAKADGDGSAALIDFIRSGPKEEGDHRISRTVAPFRTTMDSDQTNDYRARQSTERGVEPSARNVSSRVPSNRTSANSRSALLNGSSQNRDNRRPSQPDANGLKSAGAQEDEPTRKRYRNKDPYAIDFDDDDELMTALPKQGRKEESLIEFLRNHEPPNDSPPRPLIDPNSAQARRLIQNARQANARSSTDGRARTIPNSNGPRAGTSASTGMASSTRQAQINSTVSARNPSTKGRANTRTNTDDLADFARNSGPSDDPNTAPAPSVGRGSKLSPKEEEKERKKAAKGKRGSIFGRPKKQTYLDMP